MAINNKCGHHCGIITSGNVRHESHCECVECHCGHAPKNVVSILEDNSHESMR